MWRSRWAAVGAAVAVVMGTGGLLFAGAVPLTDGSTVTLITPCRLLDTRSGLDNVGPRSTPLGPSETYTATVWGTNGNCTIPTGTTGVVLNVTIVAPTAPSYLTVWPSDAARPTASNLNWVAGQDPTPNQVTTGLSADGKIKLFNATGSVNVIVDIAGYLAPSAAAPTGTSSVLYDGNGQALGEILPWSSLNEWWLHDGTDTFFLNQYGLPYEFFLNGLMAYASGDCTGPLYSSGSFYPRPDGQPNLVRLPDATEPDGWAAYAGQTGTTQVPVTLLSFFDFDTMTCNTAGAGLSITGYEVILGEKVNHVPTPLTPVVQ